MLFVNVCNMSISRFGFLAIFISYVALLLAEYLRPGFVATNGNVHWLWAVMGGWVAVDLGLKRFRSSRSIHSNDRQDDRTSVIRTICALILSMALGVILGLIVWHIGEAFGGMRLLFALAAAVTPIFLVRSSRIDS